MFACELAPCTYPLYRGGGIYDYGIILMNRTWTGRVFENQVYILPI